MQNTSRLFIRFTDKAKWDLIMDNLKLGENENQLTLREIVFSEDFGLQYQYFANGIKVDESKLSITLGDYWNDSSVKQWFEIFYNAAGEDSIIIGESYCYSVYPEVTYEIYSLGANIHEYWRSRGAEKHFSEIQPSDIGKWLGTTRKKELSDAEKKLLKDCQ